MLLAGKAPVTERSNLIIKDEEDSYCDVIYVDKRVADPSLDLPSESASDKFHYTKTTLQTM